MAYAGIAQDRAERTFALQSSRHNETFSRDWAPPHLVLGAVANQAAAVPTQESV
jgi:hypothetical protein